MSKMLKRSISFCLAAFMFLSCAAFCFAEGEDASRENQPEPRSWVRLGGANRYETSLAIGDEVGKSNSYSSAYEGVVIASGNGYADALSSACLQHTGYAPAPVLLVKDDPQVMRMIAEDIREHFARNGYDLTKQIWIVGGYGAVSPKMEEYLRDAGITGCPVIRLAGADRFETNLNVLKMYGNVQRPLIVCSGYSFADALSASACKCDIMLVRDSLTKAQEDHIQARLRSYNPDNTCVIAGGTGAVPENVENRLAELGMDTVRLGGKDRYETSYMIAEYFFKENPYYAILAYGGDYPDGLCGGPLGAANGGPVILVDDAHLEYAIKYSGEHTSVRIFKVLGGEALIPNETVEKIVYAGE